MSEKQLYYGNVAFVDSHEQRSVSGVGRRLVDVRAFLDQLSHDEDDE